MKYTGGAARDMPVMSLRALDFGAHFQYSPGWKARPNEDMIRITYEKMNEYKNGWVIEGNYSSALGRTNLFAAATDVICTPIYYVRIPRIDLICLGLDPPFLLYFPRLLWRTLTRLLGIGLPCAPGCVENWREVFFSKKSIILWCITHHSSVRRMYETMWQPVTNGGKWRRLGGWGGDFQRWWNDLELIAKSR